MNPQGPKTAEKSLPAAPFQADHGQRISEQCSQGGCQVLQLFRMHLCTAPSKLLSLTLAPIPCAQAKAAHEGTLHTHKMLKSW